MSEQKKYSLLLGLLAATFVPIPFIINASHITANNPSALILYISAVLGYIGIVLLMWMYILGTKSVIGLYFRDMAKINKLHSKLGKYGLLLIFAHPIAVALSYGQNVLLYSIIPNISTEFDEHVTFGRLALFVLLIVWVTSAIARDKIAFRPWKYIHYITYAALPLALLHIPDVGSSYNVMQGAQLYYLSVVGLFVLFSLFRIRQLFNFGKTTYVILSHEKVSTNVMALRLKAKEGKGISTIKGQYVYLQTNLLGEEHPFSVLKYNKKSGDLTIAYRMFGPFTQKLSLLEPGSELFVDGPYGTFTNQIKTTPNKPVVFVAGGIGITPFVDHIMQDSDNEQWLFYANQTKDSAVFGTELSQKLGAHSISILSKDTTEPAGNNDERGYISAGLFKKYLVRPTDYTYFICGPQVMMDVTKQSLVSIGVAPNHIFSEEFSF